MLEALLLKRNDSRHFNFIVCHIRTVLTVLAPLLILLFMNILSLYIWLAVNNSLGHSEVLIVDFRSFLFFKGQIEGVFDRRFIGASSLLLRERLEVDNGAAGSCHRRQIAQGVFFLKDNKKRSVRHSLFIRHIALEVYL